MVFCVPKEPSMSCTGGLVNKDTHRYCNYRVLLAGQVNVSWCPAFFSVFWIQGELVD